MSWINVNDFQHPTGWIGVPNVKERAKWYCRQLEQGEILFFPELPFDLPETQREFLLTQRQESSRYHKNISYRPNQDVLRGFSSASPEDVTRLRSIMREYSRQVTSFLSRFLSPYAERWSLDFASFRPIEEDERDLPLHKRNDLLHVDAFPTRPTGGGRILRVFTNINPSRPRVWNTTDRFDVLAERFALGAGLNQIAAQEASAARGLFRRAKRLMRTIGVPVVERSPYDRFMLRFHDYLKENAEFQNGCAKTRLEFPSYATWIVFTDGVPHAALSGQFALEHTYIVPIDALVSPANAPIRVLEALCGCALSG